MPGVGGGGFLGVAIETTPGTYVAPTKFIPITSEDISYIQDTVWRRPIRQSVDVIGAVSGQSRVEGSISMEALHDCVPYFLHAARATVVKTAPAVGTTDYTYAYTPSNAATASRTLSITIVRNGQVFGYVGCAVPSFSFSIEDGMLMFNPTILGNSEASQALPTPSFPTSVPFGAGSYNIQIPTATQVFDTDAFEFSVDDGGEIQYRLKNQLGAQFTAFGERSTTLSLERDFETRSDYDAFKALTSRSITLRAVQGTQSIEMVMPVAITNEYTVNLGGQGDLLRASMGYQGVIDGSGKSYTVTIITPENIA